MKICIVNLSSCSGIEVRFNGGVAIVMDNNFCLIDVLSNEPMFKKNLHPSEGVLINGTLYWTGDVSRTRRHQSYANRYFGLFFVNRPLLTTLEIS